MIFYKCASYTKKKNECVCVCNSAAFLSLELWEKSNPIQTIASMVRIMLFTGYTLTELFRIVDPRPKESQFKSSYIQYVTNSHS